MARGTPLELIIRIGAKMDKSLTATLNGTQRKVDDLARNIGRIGTYGLAAMGTLATGTVAALAKCTDAAADFENQMADVVKYVDGLADKAGEISDNVWGKSVGGNGKTFAQNYETMKDAILDLSTQIPMTAEELTRLAAAAGQSGKSISDLITTDDEGNIKGFLRDVAMVGTAMDISADQAGDWAAKWEVAMNMDHASVMDLFDQINYLGANSATTAAQIAEVVNAVAAVGDIAGFDASSTAAIADTMLAMGVDVGVASNSISRMLINMSKGTSATKAQRGAWEELGFTAQGIAEAMQAVDENGNKMAPKVLADVLERIGNMDESRQAAVLNILFGQWAIKGAAKMTGNLEAYKWALDQVGEANRDVWEGSMEREFVIKASTPEALSKLMQSSFKALQVDEGEYFLPARKQTSLAIIDFINQLRNMPELGGIAEQLATLFGKGVEWAGDKLKEATPHIQKALDYLINNGPQVIDTLKKIAVALVAMKFTPQAVALAQGAGGLLSGAGSLLFGEKKGMGESAVRTGGIIPTLFTGGRGAVNAAGGLAEGLAAASRSGGFRNAAGAMLSSLISGNGIRGTTGLLNSAAGLNGGAGGALSGFQGIGSAILDRVGNTGIGQYFGNVGAAAGNFFNRSGIWPLLKGTGSVSAQVLGNIFGFGEDYGGELNAQPLINVPGIWQGMKNAGAGAASWIGGKASAVMQSKPVQAVTGFVGNVAQSAPVQGIASMVKGVGGWMGGTLSSGLQLAGTAVGPLVSGLGSVVAGATPVVLAISGIIAVLSLLWDNVDILKGPIEAVFGEKGLAVFDSFKDGLSGVFGFIQGIFDGGLADALSGVRDMFAGAFEGEGPLSGILNTLFGGQEAGLAAFDGIVKILQSVMSFIGQVVNFATTTVKPAITEVFGFITQTVVPTLVNIFATSAPTIASILTSVGNIIMTVVQGIMGVVQALWPSIQQIVTVVMDIAAAVIPALLNAIDLILPVIQGIIDVIIPVVTVAIGAVGGLLSGLADSIGEIIAGIVEVFNGIIDFIQGVFTGNWEQAWEGVKSIFGGIWDALVGLVKTPVNAIIGIINGAISGINSISFTMPDWSPIMPGQTIGFDLPTIPLLARGGFTSGPSIAGEAGTEAVISFQSGVRGQNIATWLKAGEMLGVGGLANAGNRPVELWDLSNSPGGGGGFNITFSPNISIQGNADKQTVDAALMESEERFKSWMEQNFERMFTRMERERSRTGYA